MGHLLLWMRKPDKWRHPLPWLILAIMFPAARPTSFNSPPPPLGRFFFSLWNLHFYFVFFKLHPTTPSDVPLSTDIWKTEKDFPGQAAYMVRKTPAEITQEFGVLIAKSEFYPSTEAGREQTSLEYRACHQALGHSGGDLLQLSCWSSSILVLNSWTVTGPEIECEEDSTAWWLGPSPGRPGFQALHWWIFSYVYKVNQLQQVRPRKAEPIALWLGHSPGREETWTQIPAPEWGSEPGSPHPRWSFQPPQ